MGTKWTAAVMGEAGINLQLVDVIYPCSDGWEGPEPPSSNYYAMGKALLRPVY